MCRRITLFLLLLVSSRAVATEIKTAVEICLGFLEKGHGYSIILKESEPYILLTRGLTSKNELSLASIMARFPGGSAIVKGLPDLAKLKWVKTGPWDYQANANGHFGRIIRYHISKDAFFAVELRLELGDLNREFIQHLIGPLEQKNVNALISGADTQLSIYRLDLNDLSTREILNSFFRFLRRTSADPQYVQAVNASRSL